MSPSPRRTTAVPRFTILAAASALGAIPAPAQQTGEPPVLPTVEVRVTRETGRSPLELPFAVSVSEPDSARPGQRHLSLEETLLLLPGVTVANRHNPTQDPRISIRGFGSRSAFGVRGVRVVRDGMPLTLPDGQTPVDYLDLESIGRVEVLRGSASALYGNAAGGVIELRSEAPPAAPFAANARSWAGSDRFRRVTGEAGGTVGALSYQGTVAHTTTDGWRAHAAQRTTHGHARVTTTVGRTALSVQALLFDMPLALNPGALTLAELRARHDSTDPNSIRKRARKEVTQSQVGVLLERAFGEGEASLSLYGGTRALYNPLPFAIVDIDRISYGVTVRGSSPVMLLGTRHRLSAGVDAQMLDDDRRNFANCNPGFPVPGPGECATPGEERGALRLDQQERVSSVGLFVRDEIRLGERWLLSGGVRADQVRFDVSDRIIGPTNPDDSGDRTLQALSPMAGLLARIGLLNAVYANVSTSFETPTATELINKPDGSAGLNPELEPQRALTFELGAKGTLLALLRYDAAIYATSVTDELISFEDPANPGRRFFRNAGLTRRRGVELALGTSAGPVDLGLSWQYSHFRFAEYSDGANDHAGNRIPGIPRQQLQASATLRRGPLWATIEAQTAGSVAVDDANTVFASGYEVAHARAGGHALFGRPWISPVIGVQNVFDRRYVGAVSANAQGGRYFEPAPGRTWFAGLTVGYGR